MKISPTLILLALLGGCADADWNRNIYEGIRQRERATTPPGDVMPKPALPDYDEYRREREKLRSNQPERSGWPPARHHG